MLTWFILLPNEGRFVRVLLHMAVKAIFYKMEVVPPNN